jgi:hypothetical protein
VLTAVIWWSALQPLQGRADSFVVTTLADSGNGSLRATIASANDGDVITFAISGTITNLTGELLIGKNLDIVGPGPTNLAVSGNNASRVFNIASGASVNLSGLTICNGHARDGAEGTNAATPGWPGDGGGGIYNSGTLALTNCVITRCRSGQGGAGFSSVGGYGHTERGSSGGGPGGNGGGIYNAGTLMLAACTLSSNANGSGGVGGRSGLGNYWGGAGGNGGGGAGMYDVGAATLIGCTVAFNSAGTGGAGGYGGSGNDSQYNGAGGGRGGDGGCGGGAYSQGSPAFISCTFAGNTAGSGGRGGTGGVGNIQSNFPETVGNGGLGGDGGTGGSSGGLYCLGSFQALACTVTGNIAGDGGNGGQGGAGGMNLGPYAGTGGNGGNGGTGGGGGGASTWGGSSLQNVLAAQNSAGGGGLAGARGAAGTGHPSGSSGYPGSSGPGGSGPDLLGAFTSNGHNLIGLNDGNTGFTDGVFGDILGSGTPLNPLVGPLTNNGGPTFTCALLAGSPALDTGDDALLDAPLSLTTDQRGLPRQSGSHVDIGAVEVQWAANPIRLAACTRTTNGAIQITLTNLLGASLTMLAATNLSLPLSTWTVLGPIPEIGPGQFQFIDPAPTNRPQRLYRVRCP